MSWPWTSPSPRPAAAAGALVLVPNAHTHLLPPTCTHKTEPRRRGPFRWGKRTSADHRGTVLRWLKRRHHARGEPSGSKPGETSLAVTRSSLHAREPGGGRGASSAVRPDACVSQSPSLTEPPTPQGPRSPPAPGGSTEAEAHGSCSQKLPGSNPGPAPASCVTAGR